MGRLTFEEFADRAAAAGLGALECSPVHWQLRGGWRLVNVWPNTRRGFRFAAGDGKGRSGTLRDAIQLAGPVRPVPPEKPPRQPPAPRVGLNRRFWRWLF